MKRSVFLTPVERAVWEALLDRKGHLVADLVESVDYEREKVCEALTRFTDCKLTTLDGGCEDDETIVELAVNPNGFVTTDIPVRRELRVTPIYLEMVRFVECGGRDGAPGFVPRTSHNRQEFRRLMAKKWPELSPRTASNKVFSYRFEPEGEYWYNAWGIIVVGRAVTAIAWPGMEALNLVPDRDKRVIRIHGRRLLGAGHGLVSPPGTIPGVESRSPGDYPPDYTPPDDEATLEQELEVDDTAGHDPDEEIEEAAPPGEFETFELPILSAEGLETLTAEGLVEFARANARGREIVQENDLLLEAERERRAALVAEIDAEIEQIKAAARLLEEQARAIRNQLAEQVSQLTALKKRREEMA